MTWRTPSSLKWLIVKRARIAGTLLKFEVERAGLIDRLGYLEKRVATLTQQLAALDQTFELHDISLEPTTIRPVQPQMRKRLLPWGHLGRVILGELRKADGWLSTSEIFAKVVACATEVEHSSYEEVRHAVRRRLGTLAKTGWLERKTYVAENSKHDGRSETLWRLSHPNRTSSS